MRRRSAAAARVGAALDLGLLGGLAGDHGLDALDRLADGANLVAAGCLPDLGVDLPAGHPLQNAHQAPERAGDAEDHDHSGQQDGADEAGQGGTDQHPLRLRHGLLGVVARLPQLSVEDIDPCLHELAHLFARSRRVDQESLRRAVVVVLQAESGCPILCGIELLKDPFERQIG